MSITIDAKKYENMWKVQVLPHIKQEDYESAKYEADWIIQQLLEDLNLRRLSYLFSLSARR